MNGYALSIAAQRIDKLSYLVVANNKAAFTTRATSPEDARRIGVDIALDEYPVGDRWFNHQCAVCPVQIPEHQQTIYQAVKDRGYTDGYRPEELAGRQVLKSLEELCEAYDHLYPLMSTNGQQDDFLDLRDKLVKVRELARRLFDSRVLVGVWQPGEFKLELADIAIPLFVAAEALGVDLLALSVEKSTADVKRGVR